MAAVEAMLPLVQCTPVPPMRECWSDSCPLDSRDGYSASDVPTVEHGQAGKRPPAAGAWTKVSPAL
eukprot:6898904-Pyramimonas_sp.AAC.1